MSQGQALAIDNGDIMTLGTVLILLGVILAFISVFIPDHRHSILATAIGLVGIGVLTGAGTLTT